MSCSLDDLLPCINCFLYLQTSAWGGASPFAADPFGSQQNAQTPTDPFGSGDPFGFGDDPFASKSADSTSGKGGDSINPFQKNSARNSNSTPTKSKKREEVVVPEALAKVRYIIREERENDVFYHFFSLAARTESEGVGTHSMG